MPGNENSGDHTREYKQRSVQAILDGTAREAAELIDKYVRHVRGFTAMKPEKLRACVFVIEQSAGKAKIKIEHSGGILTYKSLVDGAEALASKPPELFIDVSKIDRN